MSSHNRPFHSSPYEKNTNTKANICVKLIYSNNGQRWSWIISKELFQYLLAMFRMRVPVWKEGSRNQRRWSQILPQNGNLSFTKIIAIFWAQMWLDVCLRSFVVRPNSVTWNTTEPTWTAEIWPRLGLISSFIWHDALSETLAVSVGLTDHSDTRGTSIEHLMEADS